MAGLYFKVEADLDKLRTLKREIDDLKVKLQHLDKSTDPKSFKAYEKQLKSTEREFENLSNKAAKESAKVNKSLDDMYQKGSTLPPMFSKIAAAIGFGSLVKETIQIRGEFQQLDVSFRTMLQSTDKAQALMGQLIETAAKTPFTLQGVAGGARQLIAYGFAAEEVNSTLLRLGNIASGLNLPLERLTYLYGTTMTQGRLYARDMMQFTASGIPMLQGLADMYGVTTEKVNEMVTAGKVGFPEVKKVIESLTNEGGKFYNLMEEQSKTITGQISNLKDELDLMFNEFGKGSEGLINGSIEGLRTLVQNYETVGKVLAGLVATYGAYRVALLLSVEAIKRYTVAETIMYKTGLLAEAANKALKATMLTNPYVLATVAIMGTVAAIWALHDSSTSAERALKSYNEEKEAAAKKEEEHKNKIEELIQVANNQALADLDRQKALDILKNEYPKIFEKYDLEKLKLSDILQIKKEIAEIDSNKKVQETKNNYDTELAKIAQIEAKIKRLTIEQAESPSAQRAGLIMAEKDNLNDAKNRLALFRNEVEKDSVASWKNTISKMSDAQIQAEMSMRERLKYSIEKSGDKKGQVAEIIGLGAFSKTELQAQTEALKVEMDKRKIPLISYADAQKKIEKELSDLQEKRANLKSKKLTATEFESELKQIDEDISAVQTRLKVFQETKKDNSIKYDLEEKRRKEDLQNATIQSEINLMSEGSDKELAKMQETHRLKLQSIDRQEEDLLKKLRDNAEKEWKEKGGKGSFKSNLTLDARTTDLFDKLRYNEGLSYTSQYRDFISNSLKDFEDFKKKIEDINERYNSKISLFGDDPSRTSEKMEAERQRQEELEVFDREISSRSESFSKWVSSVVFLGIKELNSALLTAKMTLDTGNSLSDEEKAILRERIRTLENLINNIDAEPEEKNLKNTYQILSDVNDVVEDIVSNFKGLDDGTKKVFSGITDFTGGVLKAATGVEQFGKAITNVEKASVILSVVSAIIQAWNALNGLLAQASEAQNNRIMAEWDAYEAILNQNEELRKQYDWTQKIGESRLAFAKREGEELSKQAAANKKETNDLWGKLQSEGTFKEEKKGFYWDWKTLEGGYGKHEVDSSLKGKSFEEIADLSNKGLLSEAAESYYKRLKKLKDEGADIEKMQLEYLERLREEFTGTTYSSIVDSIVQGFREGKRSAEDFASTFSDLMQTAVEQSLSLFVDERTHGWFEDYAEMAEDGLSAEDIEKLKSSWNTIINDSEKKAKELEKITGISIGEKSDTSERSKSGFASASQESIDELTGRATAIHMTAVSSEAILLRASDFLQGMSSELLNQSDIMKDTALWTQEIRNIQAQALIHLEDISNNTKKLGDISEDIKKVVKNTDIL